MIRNMRKNNIIKEAPLVVLFNTNLNASRSMMRDNSVSKVSLCEFYKSDFYYTLKPYKLLP